jgi:hypothetical protein
VKREMGETRGETRERARVRELKELPIRENKGVKWENGRKGE